MPHDSINLLTLPYELDAHQEAGIDEAGRGCGAGPVVAAAVILPASISIPDLRDSKKMSAQARAYAAEFIKENALAWGIGEATAQEIDKFNILNATYLAMHRAIAQLNRRPELLLIDGNRFKNSTHIDYRTIIKGDDKIMSIAAASVLAKTHRDQIMAEYHSLYPEYGWYDNKGYLTLRHRNAVRKFGLTKYHRQSFKILSDSEPGIDLFD